MTPTPTRRRTLIGFSCALCVGMAAPGLTLMGCATPGTRRPALAQPSLSPADLAWLNRITFGATTGAAAHLARVGRDQFLREQLTVASSSPWPEPVAAQLTELTASVQPMPLRVREADERRRGADRTEGSDADRQAAQKSYQQGLSDLQRDAQHRLLLRAVYSEHQLQEQLHWFWLHHFNVHGGKQNLRAMVGDYDDALRPHALGRFRDLLRASAFHPAMLRYLDNAQNRVKGLNENYARELLELHTLGVDGGYTQADVQALARVLTGLGVERDDDPPRLPPRLQDQWVQRGLMRFNPQRHDAAPKTVLGHAVGGQGLSEIEGVLDLLAAHPSTARFISRKLAQAFVADEPAPALVGRMAARFTQSQGDIAAVVREMIASPEFDASLGRKFKDPVHYVVSAVRLAFDDKPILNPQPMLNWLHRMGQAPFNRQTPDGYPLDEVSWASPGQMNVRFDIARAIGSGSAGLFKVEGARPRERAAFPQLANALYYQSWAATLGPPTRQALDQAQSPQEWNTLFLASPEFMHR